MKRISAVVVASLLALPVATAAQQDPDSTGRRHRAEWTSRADRFDLASRILSMRDELELTDDQVAKLTHIQSKYADQNRPILDRMRERRAEAAPEREARRDSVRRMTREERSETRRKMRDQRKAWLEANPEAARDLEQLRDNAKAMREEIGDVLTGNQREELRELVKERHGKRGFGGRHRGRHG